MTDPFFFEDTSHEATASSGTPLFVNISTEVMFDLYVLLWKSDDENAVQLCIIGSGSLALAVSVMSLFISYLSLEFPILVSPLYHPSISYPFAVFTVISGKVISHVLSLLYKLHTSASFSVDVTPSPIS